MKKLAALFAMVLITGVAAAAIAACGGGVDSKANDANLKEYFRQVRLLVNDLDSRTEDRTVQNAHDAFLAWSIVLSDTSSKLRDIVPPDDLADTHRALYTALDDGALAISKVAQDHPNVKELTEVQTLVAGSTAVTEANNHARTACSEMEAYAKDHDATLDLELC
ncbi:MAG: hypothetical protein WBD55_03060 [Dehalococcoidia bacterium]